MTEFERARQWRLHNRFTKVRLSELTGFSVSSIDAFEKGESRTGDAVDTNAFKRYRLCCASIALLAGRVRPTDQQIEERVRLACQVVPDVAAETVRAIILAEFAHFNW